MVAMILCTEDLQPAGSGSLWSAGLHRQVHCFCLTNEEMEDPRTKHAQGHVAEK